MFQYKHTTLNFLTCANFFIFIYTLLVPIYKSMVGGNADLIGRRDGLKYG